MKKIIFFLFLFLTTPPVWACSVCFKDPDSQITIGLQNGVLTLLGFLLIVFFALIKFIYSFSRRSQMQQEVKN